MVRCRTARTIASLALVALASLALWACAGSPSGRDASAAPATAPSTAPVTAPLTVVVKDLRNKKGQLIFGVFRTGDGFPNVEAKSVYWEVKDAAADSVAFTAHLPPGRYAASVLHDENRSGDMDRGFGGIPREGYGVTNNPKPALRAATFDEAAFTLPPEGAAKTISIQYF